MTYKLAKICQLTNMAKNITVAPTFIESSSMGYNTIPKHCCAHIDTRFCSNEDGDELHHKIMRILKTVEVTAYDDFKPAETSVVIADHSPALIKKETDHVLSEYYKEIIHAIEHKWVIDKLSHGSADCNLMMTSDTIFIGGLGAVGSGQHTRKEVVKLSSLVTRAQASAELLDFINATLE